MGFARLLLCLIVVSLPSVVGAQPVRVGSELQIDTPTSRGWSPRIGADTMGNFIVVWQSGDLIRGRRFSRAGEPLSTEFTVNSEPRSPSIDVGIFIDVDVSVGPDGSFVVVWTSSEDSNPLDPSVFGRRFDSSGSPIGTDFRVNTQTLGYQYYPSVAGSPHDGFVVAWQNYDFYHPGYYTSRARSVVGRRFDGDGVAVGSEFQISTYTSTRHSFVDLKQRSDGSFIAVWHDQDYQGTFGQMFESDGSRLGSQFQVNPGGDLGLLPGIGADEDGSFVVVWTDSDGDEAGLFGRRFDSSGSPVSSEFQVNTHTLGTQYTLSHGLFVAPKGDFVVTWIGPEGLALSDVPNNVFAQKFDSSAARVGTEFQVSTYTGRVWGFPAVSGDSDSFVISWVDVSSSETDAILGQRFLNELECPDTPKPDCVAAGRSALIIKRPLPAEGSFDTFVWRWRNALNAGPEQASSPSGYVMCLYDASGLVAEVRVSGDCNEDSCWRVSGGLGAGSEARGTYGPATLLRHRWRDSTSRFLLRGRGRDLSLPRLPLDDTAVTLQLHRSDATSCLEGIYSGPALRNDTVEYRDRARTVLTE